MAKQKISKKIENIAKDYVKHLQKNGLFINEVFIYGSHAKGLDKKWSDIDICIISNDFKKSIDPLTYLWSQKRNKDINAIISPVGFHPKDFINENPLVWEIKKTGVAISI